MQITRGDGTGVLAAGLDDPQAMRMILLQILTGRRASEIRTCDYDCLSPAGNLAGAEGEITRFRYAQSKIDIAPDTILVDREVTAIIEEQQAWLGEQYPGFRSSSCSCRLGGKPYASGTYNWVLRELSDIARFTDSKNRPVRLSHTHRFRHTRLTKRLRRGRRPGKRSLTRH
jgi:integrase